MHWYYADMDLAEYSLSGKMEMVCIATEEECPVISVRAIQNIHKF
jgi:hypothetical protein